MTIVEADPFAVHRALTAPGPLRDFNAAGALTTADVQVARRLGELGKSEDEQVLLAAALAVRAPRVGHVYVDLATVRETITVESEESVDLPGLPWPEPLDWVDCVAASDLVTTGDDAGLGESPLRLVGSWLYLDRYWQEERQVAQDLLEIVSPATVSMRTLSKGLKRMFPGEADSRQCLAAATALLRRLAVVAGGPGTGKTTTVARIIALLAEQAVATGATPPLVALAAPTGKAAARLEEAVHDEATTLPVDEAIRSRLLELRASTLHRLLGWRPDSHSRFRHNRGQRLPHDVIIIDEASMVSLSLMARLVESVRPDARLVLVGDPGQLASIEAGAVLGDLVGPAGQELLMTAAARTRLTEATGQDVDGVRPVEHTGVGDGIVALDRVHRYGGTIARLADAIRSGDVDEALRALQSSPRRSSGSQRTQPTRECWTWSAKAPNPPLKPLWNGPEQATRRELLANWRPTACSVPTAEDHTALRHGMHG